MPHTSLSTTRRALMALLLVITLGASTAQAEIIDRVAARVNAEIITLHDVREAATPFLLQNNMDPKLLEDASRREKIYKQVLLDLIERKLMVQEAQRLDMSVSDQELERWLTYNRQQRGLTEAQFKEIVEQYGMNYSEYRERVRERLLRERITQFKVGAKVSVSDAEVEAAYREQYGEQPRLEPFLTISHILIQPKTNSEEDVKEARARIDALVKRLDGGEDFAALARDASDGPSAKKDGVLGSFRRGQLDPEFERAAFGLRVGQRSGVVRTKFGFHVIKVVKAEERNVPEVEERKEKLRFELRQKAMERRQRAYLQTLKSRAFVDVKM